MNLNNMNAESGVAGKPHHFTRHASVRMQQRGIPPFIIEAAQRFGKKQHIAGNAVRYDFDSRAIRRSLGHFGSPMKRVLEDFNGTYVVMSHDDTVITAAPRHSKRKGS